MMSFRNRMLGLTAGTLLLSCFSSTAQAQTDVLNFTGSSFVSESFFEGSTFTLNQSLILNNIGFVYNSSIDDGGYSFSYQIGSQINGFNGPIFTPSFSSGTLTTADLEPASNGVRYLKSFTAQEYASGTVVKIRSQSPVFDFLGPGYKRIGFSDNLVGITHTSAGGAAGNIRVSNPGSNVAPEPGSFALALTGGGALIGICIRRRRNAA